MESQESQRHLDAKAIAQSLKQSMDRMNRVTNDPESVTEEDLQDPSFLQEINDMRRWQDRAYISLGVEYQRPPNFHDKVWSDIKQLFS